MVGEHALELVGVNELLALLRSQGPHATNGSLEHLAAFRRELPDFLVKLVPLPLLVGREVLPGFHPVQGAFLLPDGQAQEVLLLLQQLRLPVRRKLLEGGIAFERLPLLIRRKALVAAEPVAKVIPGRAFLASLLLFLLLLLLGALSRLWGRLHLRVSPHSGALSRPRDTAQQECRHGDKHDF